MKQQFKGFFYLCAAGAFLSGGCAKQEVVKPDQMIPPVASSASTVVPAKTAAQSEVKAETKDAALPAQPIKESQLDKQPLQPAASQSDLALNAALEKVYFDFDSYTLSPEAREVLTKNAELIKSKAKVNIRIEGHCDELGSDDYNLALGERRARTALNYLQSLGVSSSRLSAISYGKEKPADPGHDDSARAKNRRDEFVISSK